jgi:hypothetical protein
LIIDKRLVWWLTDGFRTFVAQESMAAGVRTVDGVAVTPFSNNAKLDYLGSVLPDLYGSINSSFKYKPWLDFIYLSNRDKFRF